MSKASSSDRPFFETTALAEMTPAQFEALCDGCARCCMHKLEDIDTGRIVFTDVACRLLDIETARCTDYANRTKRVDGCVSMSPDNLDALGFLPDSCAYRRIDEGRGLADWHPLVSGDPRSVRNAGLSMADAAVSEVYVPADDIPLRQRADIAWSPPPATATKR